MERTELLNTLKQKFSSNKRIIALLGPRQCGKTTLAKSYCATIANFVRRNYFDLEHPLDSERLKQPYQNLKDLTGLIVIDEIQRSKDIFPILRVLHDENTYQQFLILGSASKHLIQQSSESLTGRIHYQGITPFSFSEIKEWKNLWFRGGFPRSYLAASDTESIEWRSDYVRTLLEQDVPNLGFKIPATHLRRFWMILANFHGQILNTNTIAVDLQLSAQTVKRYLDLLQDMFMVRILQPWYTNIGKRQVKSPKIYVRDSGILHYLIHIINQDEFFLSPKKGASFEGFVIEEIIRTLKVSPEECFYWRTHTGIELDLLIVRGNSKFGFEIKMVDKPSITKAMHISYQDLELDHMYLVHPGDVSWQLDKWITALSFNDLITVKI